jgi:hypothetical protein
VENRRVRRLSDRPVLSNVLVPIGEGYLYLRCTRAEPWVTHESRWSNYHSREVGLDLAYLEPADGFEYLLTEGGVIPSSQTVDEGRAEEIGLASAAVALWMR